MDKHEHGVVVLLKGARLVLLTSELHRHEAARLIRQEKHGLRHLKFFPMAAGQAAEAIRKLNQSGLLASLLSDDMNNPAWIPTGTRHKRL